MIGLHGHSRLVPSLLGGQGGTPSEASTSMRIDGTTKKFAYKFYVSTTSPITDINLYVLKIGTVTGINFKIEVQADSSDAPSGTALGASTAAFAGPAANGFLGNKTLGSDTGALSINTPYWMVFSYASGTAPDASNYITAAIGGAIGRLVNDSKLRYFNGTDWTTVAVSSNHGLFVATHVDGTLTGIPTSNTNANNGSATAVFGTNRQGLTWVDGSLTTVYGAAFQTTKTGSPSALELVLYEGSTQRATSSLAAAQVITNSDYTVVLFTTPYQVQPDTTRYLVLRQLSNGGDASNNYNLRGNSVPSGFLNAMCSPAFRMVRGTGDDPTALTVDAAFSPRMFPLVGDLAIGLDSSGGGSPRFGLAGGGPSFRGVE